jgi:hypothetical protein
MVGVEEAKVGSTEGVFVMESPGDIVIVGEDGIVVNVGVGVFVGVSVGEGGRQSRKQF